MIEYYKTLLEKVSFDRNLFRKEYNKAISNLNKKEVDDLKKWLQDKKLIKMDEKEIYNKLIHILVEMGYSKDKITEYTSLKTDLSFDYLDFADFIIRIEKEFMISVPIGSIIPDMTFPDFENIRNTINYILDNQTNYYI